MSGDFTTFLGIALADVRGFVQNALTFSPKNQPLCSCSLYTVSLWSVVFRFHNTFSPQSG